ncbi:MAG: YggT family protein [Anaerolineales bacterium]|jgi:YggT family protein|uniref:YggT family protein n=1 Tax=Candidatus Villigracilis vicinus TaxID=3140679 RepID=UPI003136F64A|nr:YggT family protein [Anaerolineales bacterium]MBK7449187.1 YggT family protein [Anaerolineales bacterium]MBK9781165.1 YggT family protein [Anaerolineales bacterium]
MNVDFLILLIRVVVQTFIWVVIANSLLSFFLSPYHPVREALERLVSPLLNPIRNIMPSTGGIDFSPLVLILALDFLSRIFIAILLAL